MDTKIKFYHKDYKIKIEGIISSSDLYISLYEGSFLDIVKSF